MEFALFYPINARCYKRCFCVFGSNKHESLFEWQHANAVMVALSGLAVLFAVIPFKFFLMAIILQSFVMTSKKGKSSGAGNRRLMEWWDSIPIVPVRVVDKVPDNDSAK